MVVLGIETSCDETSAAVVQNGCALSNVVSSSVPLHAKYGGVVPEIASRFHIEYINKVTKQALRKARKSLKDIDLVAVTENPGLPGSLISGKAFARAISFSLGIPLLGVDHLLAHIFANWLSKEKSNIGFPFIGAVVSGGHTNIFVCKSLRDCKSIGRTKDDAVGEAFDKVSKILGLGYPGGPAIEKSAKKFKGPKGINVPRTYLGRDSFDFSLSGLKTAVLYYARNLKLTSSEKSKISWSFQEAVFDVLVEKIVNAARKLGIAKILLGGGVTANLRLREKLGIACEKARLGLYYPPFSLCLDNAAMVAGLGEQVFNEGRAQA